jgi:hypothetical protein
MTLAALIAISLMWWTLGLMFLGKGEPKVTGAISGLVGLLVVVVGVLESVSGNNFGAGLLYAHGLLYLVTCYALLAGVEDLRSVGNVSLTVMVISAVYCIAWATGGPVGADGKQLVGKVPYLAFCAAGYTVLTLEVFLVGHGKLNPKVLAWCLMIWAIVGLWVPAFELLIAGKLPF